MIEAFCISMAIATCPAVHELKGDLANHYHGLYHIQTNQIFVEDLNDMDTVVHELCHAKLVQDFGYKGHGKLFKECMHEHSELCNC